MTSERPEFSRLVPLARLEHRALPRSKSRRPRRSAKALSRRFDLMCPRPARPPRWSSAGKAGEVILSAGRISRPSSSRAASSRSNRSPARCRTASRCATRRPAAGRGEHGIRWRDEAFEPLDGDSIDIGEAVAQEFPWRSIPFRGPRRDDRRSRGSSARGPDPFAALSQRPAQCDGMAAPCRRLNGGHRSAAARVAGPRFLAKYAARARTAVAKLLALSTSETYIMAVPKKKTSHVAPQYAPLASCAEVGRLCRMPELRRAEAAAPLCARLRPLRRPRGDAAASAGGLTAGRRREAYATR